MALAIIEEIWGTETAESIANATEYSWHRDPDNDPFFKFLHASLGALTGND